MLGRLPVLAAALALALLALPGGALAHGRLDRMVKRDLRFARAQLRRTLKETPRNAYPQETRKGGRWNDYCCSWTGGFFPGSLWLMYKATGDRRWRKVAKRREAGLEAWKGDTSTHDVGLLINDSFGRGYRLTHNDRFRKVVLTAARSLATRYSSTVHAIRSWNDRRGERRSDFRVIVDGMMNIELLFWAARHGGGPGMEHIAHEHAITTALHHIRPDGSTFHLVIFDSRTGAVRHKGTVQGYRDSSTWARGQAWAIDGFTNALRETHDWRLLLAARKVADYYVAHLPHDKVPYWDFQAPGRPHAPRDSSAAAIAASGLLELSRLEIDRQRARRYLRTAKATLRSLSSKRYLAKGTRSRSILLHGTADKPAGHYDRGLIYGDYYFLEALLRYRSMKRHPVAVDSVISIHQDR